MAGDGHRSGIIATLRLNRTEAFLWGRLGAPGAMVLARAAAARWKVRRGIRTQDRNDQREAEQNEQQRCKRATHGRPLPMRHQFAWIVEGSHELS